MVSQLHNIAMRKMNMSQLFMIRSCGCGFSNAVCVDDNSDERQGNPHSAVHRKRNENTIVPRHSPGRGVAISSATVLRQWPTWIFSEVMTSSKTIVLLCLAVCLLGTVQYWRSGECGFVFDDRPAITKNADSNANTSSVAKLFRNDFWGRRTSKPDSHKSYRPLVILTYRLQSWLHGEHDPAWLHYVNAGFHGVVCIVVFAIAYGFYRDATISTLSAAYFAVHPIHVEAVAGLVGRAEEMCAIFYVMGFAAYRKYRSSSSILSQSFWLLMLGVCYYAASTCAILVPYAFADRQQAPPRKWVSRW